MPERPPQLALDTVAERAARAQTLAALFGDEPAAPERIGGYGVLDVLGRGAMGVVYLAHDDSLDRQVALKLLDPGLRGDAEAADALVKEAQQIAKVVHPNVVTVYEVGEHRGDAFIAMEYVPGPTLREWTLAGGHSNRQVIETYAGAGRGLAAVHEAGLLHRDFKPSNVLVMGGGIAKVADFGLARLVADPPGLESGSEPTEDAKSTPGTSRVLAGTPAYMAPETLQAGASALSDQFAFGVALIEALVGVHPFNRQPPFSIAAEDAARQLGALERRGISGSLWSVLERAVAWDPAQRWPDMRSLVDAVESDGVRRRRRWIVGLSAVAAVGVGAFVLDAQRRSLAQRCTGAQNLIAHAWGDTDRADVARAFTDAEVPYAADTLSRTVGELDAYAGAWARTHTAACTATTVRGEQSAEVMDLQIACLHRAKTSLRAAVHVLVDADADVVARAPAVLQGLMPLSRCEDVASLVEGVDPPTEAEADAVAAIREHLVQARAQAAAGRSSAADEALAQARARLQTVSYLPIHVEASLGAATVLEHQGRYVRAETELRTTLELAAAAGLWEELWAAQTHLIEVVGSRLQRPQAGLRYSETARGLARGDPQKLGRVEMHVGLAHLAQGKYGLAEVSFRSALGSFEAAYGPEHAVTAIAHNNLSAALSSQESWEEAELHARRGLEIRDHAWGSDHPQTLESRHNLALLLMLRGRLNAAESEARAALEGRRRVYGASHASVAESMQAIALILHRGGRFEEAQPVYEQALAMRRELLGASNPSTAETLANLADLLAERKDYGGAKDRAEDALAILEPLLGSEHPSIAAVRDTRAGAWAGLGELERAKEEYEAVLELFSASLGGDHLEVARTRIELADVLLRQGQQEAAATMAESAWARLSEDDVDEELRADAASVRERARRAR